MCSSQSLSLAGVVFLWILPYSQVNVIFQTNQKKRIINLFNLQQLRGVSIVKLNCTPNAALCKDPICSLSSTAEEPLKFKISFGCTLLKSVPQLKVRFQTHTP
jgi:hypothetical protein